MPKYLQLFKYLNVFIPWYKYKSKTYKMQKYQSMSLNAPLSPQTLSLRRLRSRQPPPFVASPVQSICQGRVGNPNVKTGKKCFDKLHFNEGVVRSTRQFCSAGTLPSSDGGFDEGNLIKDGDRDQVQSQRQSKMNTGKTRLQRDQKFQSWMGRDVSFPESGTGLA